MKVRGFLCAVVLAMGSFSAGAESAITMKATPEFSFAPAHLTVRTRIEPDAGNRAIEIAIDSENFYRSTTIELEGDQAPRTSVFEFRGVPGGRYEVSAKLVGSGGSERGLVRKRLSVIATGAERQQ